MTLLCALTLPQSALGFECIREVASVPAKHIALLPDGRVLAGGHTKLHYVDPKGGLAEEVAVPGVTTGIRFIMELRDKSVVAAATGLPAPGDPAHWTLLLFRENRSPEEFPLESQIEGDVIGGASLFDRIFIRRHFSSCKRPHEP